MHLADHPTPSAITTTVANKSIPAVAYAGGFASNVPAVISITNNDADQRHAHAIIDLVKDGFNM
tara:strand:- start:238 stop:429 length:192 start_codon:yes stop_codon:yes gene_type:complete